MRKIKAYEAYCTAHRMHGQFVKYEKIFDRILDYIKIEARNGAFGMGIHLGPSLEPFKDEMIDKLKDLGYDILIDSSNDIRVRWARGKSWPRAHVLKTYIITKVARALYYFIPYHMAFNYVMSSIDLATKEGHRKVTLAVPIDRKRLDDTLMKNLR